MLGRAAPPQGRREPPSRPTRPVVVDRVIDVVNSHDHGALLSCFTLSAEVDAFGALFRGEDERVEWASILLADTTVRLTDAIAIPDPAGFAVRAQVRSARSVDAITLTFTLTADDRVGRLRLAR